MDAETYTYLLAHTREPAPLAKLRATTEGLRGAHMQVAPEQGALLALLAELTNARRCLEVGVFTGYSSLAVALALKRGEERDKERENDSDSTTDQRDQNRRDEGAQNTDDQKKDRNRVLVALDRDEGMMAVARSAWREAGVEHLVDGRVGAALPELDAMLEDPDEVESYDLAFIDADKRAYPQYYERCLRLIRPGGLAVVDNVLFYGRVATPERCAGDKAATALREFNSLLLKDERISLSILPVGDGMALCWKRP
jgi:predicted O-methyltransferase YrrM